MTLTVFPVEGIGEVSSGDDLARLIAEQVELADGDILVVTSKVVSKAEGRVLSMEREAAIDLETDREVSRRGPTRIVRNRLGLTMAAAGVDASNTAPGTVVLLPVDPDASARGIREGLAPNVAVIVTDTIGRAWREGQTDIAIGAAGIDVLHDYEGRLDSYGNQLSVTAPAIADELAGAGDLVKGKLSHSPVAVVRGLAELVLPRAEHGQGAAALVRAEAHDMFGYGAREAVLHALLVNEVRGFGAAASADVVARALSALAPAQVDGEHVTVELGHDDPRAQGRLEARLTAAAYAHSWEIAEETPGTVSFRPRSP